MNTNEAKFILRARRPDGRDDADPLFAEALQLSRLNPALSAWLAREQAFDQAVSSRLRELAPPPGLRDSILAGARMQAPAVWWTQARTFAIAASLTVLLGLAAFWNFSLRSPGGERFALGAMADWEEPSHHPVIMGGSGALGRLLASSRLRLAEGLPLDFSTLTAEGCRSIRIAGREVVEVCFIREGAGEYHLYIARRSDFGGDQLDDQPIFRERGTLASVSWADRDHAYVLLSDASSDALRSVL